MNVKKCLYQMFGLPFWVLSLGLAGQAAMAGIDDVQLYYRYVPYQPPAGSPGAKPSSGANQAEVKKEQQAGQPAPNQQASPSEQVKQNIENPLPNPNPAGNLSSSQLSSPTCESGEKAPCVRNTGQEPKQQAQSEATGTGGQTSASQDDKGQASGQPSSQTSPSGQASPSSGQTNPTLKESTGMAAGKVPEFAQVDSNGDHYVTRDELQNYPDLLKIFDKVDAGKDGKLEQHEFQNLEMEARREGEVL